MNTLSIQIDEQIKSHFNHFLTANDASVNDRDITATRQKIKQIRNATDDAYVMEQMAGLEAMVKMISDETWTVSAENAALINATIRYVLDDRDLIPDHIPGIGFIDDCIVIDNTLDVIEHELSEFKDFSRTRMVYAKNGIFTLSDWHKIKDQESASRIRNRRQRRASLSGQW